MTTLDTGPTPWATLNEVRDANRNTGHHFFSRGAMQWFHSRIESSLIRGRYFITSEQREDEPYVDAKGDIQPPTERRYTIRYAQDDGVIETIGDHHAYASTAEAMTALLEHDQQRLSHAVGQAT